MLNEVQIEGIVARESWSYDRDLFFRIASYRDAGLPAKVLPVKFSETEKSAIGYGLIQIIETGRCREYAPLDEDLLQQLEHCAAQVRSGPAKLLRWGVPEGKRNPAGQYLHDDLLLSLALIAVLDRLDWHTPTPAASVEGFDPLAWSS